MPNFYVIQRSSRLHDFTSESKSNIRFSCSHGARTAMKFLIATSKVSLIVHVVLLLWWCKDGRFWFTICIPMIKDQQSSCDITLIAPKDKPNKNSAWEIRRITMGEISPQNSRPQGADDRLIWTIWFRPINESWFPLTLAILSRAIEIESIVWLMSGSQSRSLLSLSELQHKRYQPIFFQLLELQATIVFNPFCLIGWLSN